MCVDEGACEHKVHGVPFAGNGTRCVLALASNEICDPAQGTPPSNVLGQFQASLVDRHRYPYCWGVCVRVLCVVWCGVMWCGGVVSCTAFVVDCVPVCTLGQPQWRGVGLSVTTTQYALRLPVIRHDS